MNDLSDFMIVYGIVFLLLLFIGCDSALVCKTVVSLAQCAAIIYAIRKTGSAWCLLAMLCLAVIW